MNNRKKNLKEILVGVSVGLGFVFLTPVANLATRGSDYYYARKEAKKEFYGHNLKQQWQEEANNNWNKLISYKVWIPFNWYFESSSCPFIPSFDLDDPEGLIKEVDLTPEGKVQIKFNK